jgi:hypothetical protein
MEGLKMGLIGKLIKLKIAKEIGEKVFKMIRNRGAVKRDNSYKSTTTKSDYKY